MPIWSEILREVVGGSSNKSPPDFDGVRRKYLHKLSLHTGRDVILYASGWLQKERVPSNLMSIVGEDIHGLMEVTAKFDGTDIDLILHSPGGSVNAAEAIVSYLRSHYSYIRVLVPLYASSAAAMIACAADEIVMGNHSFLGPTDPQLSLSTPLGFRPVAAQEILEQFSMAVDECSDPSRLSAWLPMLSQFGPDLIVNSQNALKLSKSLVKRWLRDYMFKGDTNSDEKSKLIAKWLTNHKKLKSHGRHLSKEKLIKKGLKIQHMENDQDLQDLCLSVFHATTMAFANTPTTKIIENQHGQAFIKNYYGQLPS